MKNNLIKEKSFEFSLKIIRLSKNLRSKNKEYVISQQILKSGTSIGANVVEAIEASSRKDFIAKLKISLRETLETEYWLDLLEKTEDIDVSLLKLDVVEIKRILIAIVKTTKANS